MMASDPAYAYQIEEHREAVMVRRLTAEQATQHRLRAEREARAASLRGKAQGAAS